MVCSQNPVYCHFSNSGSWCLVGCGPAGACRVKWWTTWKLLLGCMHSPYYWSHRATFPKMCVALVQGGTHSGKQHKTFNYLGSSCTTQKDLLVQLPFYLAQVHLASVDPISSRWTPEPEVMGCQSNECGNLYYTLLPVYERCIGMETHQGEKIPDLGELWTKAKL